MIESVENFWHAHGPHSVRNLIQLFGTEHRVDRMIKMPPTLLKGVELQLRHAKSLFWLRIVCTSLMFVFFLFFVLTAALFWFSLHILI